MSKLILIDHSLKGVGGHHYEYDLAILRAAQSAGFELALATHRRFRGSRVPVPDCWIISPFRHQTYSEYSVLSRCSGRPRNPYRPRTANELATAEPGSESLWARLKTWRRSRRQRRCLDTFVRHLRQVFQPIEAEPGDQVFVPTCSEFDLVGVVQFLQSVPRGRELDWHLQFHFNFLDGGEPDYMRQEARVFHMREHFAFLLRQVPDFRLHFYATTDQMVAQFNCLQTAQFQRLPYPIRADFRPAERLVADQPLRVLCAGGVRPEKGTQHLEPLVHSLWDEFCATGKIQFLVQAKHRRALPKPPRYASVNEHGARTTVAATCQPAIVHVPHPMSGTEYCELIRSADIGLFLYDRHRYYARCSGVLVEMLCCGVPVIVPAGCWLAEEIAAENYPYLDALARTLPLVQRVRPDGLRGLHEQQPGGELTFGGAAAGATCEMLVPSTATELWLAFKRRLPLEPGQYVRLDCEQFNRDGDLVHRFATTVGSRTNNTPVPVLFHLRSGAERLRLAWRNAYQDTAVTVTDLEVRFLSAANPGGSCPAGSLGLIAADHEQIGALLQDITTHYAHYRQCAREFSATYRAQHDPLRIIKQLAAAGQISADRPQAA